MVERKAAQTEGAVSFSSVFRTGDTFVLLGLRLVLLPEQEDDGDRRNYGWSFLGKPEKVEKAMMSDKKGPERGLRALVKTFQLCCSSSSLVYRHLGLGQAM